MDSQNLVQMANRIGEFFQAMPDREEAVDGVAQHLRKFWEPRMRRVLLQHAAAGGSEELHELVAAALVRHRSLLMPA